MIAMATWYFENSGASIQGGVTDFAARQGGVRWRDLVTIPTPLMRTGNIRRYRLEGLVIALWSSEVEQEVRDLDMAAVNVSNSVPDVSMPSVLIDDLKVGAAAGAYFLERGHLHFGYVCGDTPRQVRVYAEQRGRGFCEAVQAAGASVSWYGPWPPTLPAGAVRAVGEMTAWLKNLPKPVAIFTAEDRTAAAVHAATVAAKLNVPEQVSILGVDNSSTTHYMMTGISSIALPFHQLGFRAAETLDGLLSGKTPAEQRVSLPPGQIITRTSSDAHAIGDAHVLDALRYIRERACDGIEVEDVVAGAYLGRRSLERRFRSALGITLKEEIARVRIATARRLLTTTRLSIDEIARASGYRTRSQFFIAFRAATGLQPNRYRVANTMVVI